MFHGSVFSEKRDVIPVLCCTPRFVIGMISDQLCFRQPGCFSTSLVDIPVVILNLDLLFILYPTHPTLFPWYLNYLMWEWFLDYSLISRNDTSIIPYFSVILSDVGLILRWFHDFWGSYQYLYWVLEWYFDNSMISEAVWFDNIIIVGLIVRSFHEFWGSIHYIGVGLILLLFYVFWGSIICYIWCWNVTSIIPWFLWLYLLPARALVWVVSKKLRTYVRTYVRTCVRPDFLWLLPMSISPPDRFLECLYHSGFWWIAEMWYFRGCQFLQ